ncbi:hypothetical protein [Geofilum rubicundum]|nr:hypothetical protein [Geofilum rubicundum]
MRKQLLTFAAAMILGLSMAPNASAQLSDEEYNYVTMDLRGILNLTMTTNPQVDFVFKTIQEYQQGITRFNATQLEVDATLAWDLFVYASTDNWTQVEAYSTNGNPVLPAEILEMQSSVTSAAPVNMNAFTSLLGLTNSTVAAGVPTAATQFLAGEFGTAAGQSFDPGTASANPDTHQFRIDMRLRPEVPATFATTGVDLTLDGNNIAFAQAGYYYMEVVYSLVEDL